MLDTPDLEEWFCQAGIVVARTWSGSYHDDTAEFREQVRVHRLRLKRTEAMFNERRHCENN